MENAIKITLKLQIANLLLLYEYFNFHGSKKNKHMTIKLDNCLELRKIKKKN